MINVKIIQDIPDWKTYQYNRVHNFENSNSLVSILSARSCVNCIATSIFPAFYFYLDIAAGCVQVKQREKARLT